MTSPHIGNSVTKALVMALPSTGRDSGNASAEVIDGDIAIELHVVVVAEVAEDLPDGILLLGHEQSLAVAVAVECAARTEAFQQPLPHGGIVVATHVGEYVAKSTCRIDDAHLLEVLALAVGKSIGIDTCAPSDLGRHMLAREVSQALVAQRTAAIETERIAAGDTIEIEVFVFHNYLLSC